jgi:hypothetical protein
MIINELKPLDDFSLWIKTSQGDIAIFDVKPYLSYEAFLPLCKLAEFKKVSNNGYFIEWDCGADLSADTIEAKMTVVGCFENEPLLTREDDKKTYPDAE